MFSGIVVSGRDVNVPKRLSKPETEESLCAGQMSIGPTRVLAVPARRQLFAPQMQSGRRHVVSFGPEAKAGRLSLPILSCVSVSRSIQIRPQSILGIASDRSISAGSREFFVPYTAIVRERDATPARTIIGLFSLRRSRPRNSVPIVAARCCSSRRRMIARTVAIRFADHVPLLL